MIIIMIPKDARYIPLDRVDMVIDAKNAELGVHRAGTSATLYLTDTDYNQNVRRRGNVFDITVPEEWHTHLLAGKQVHRLMVHADEITIATDNSHD